MSEYLQEYPKLELVGPADPGLSEPASAVLLNEIESPRLQNIIDCMIELARGTTNENRRMVGLAAPQVGVSERIIIVDQQPTASEPDFKVYINPELLAKSDERSENREGCYSTDRVCGIVERSDWVVVQAIDRHGSRMSPQTVEDPFVARVIQHEIDHLDGIRFPDRITDDEKLLWVEHEEFPEFRHTWAAWPHKCSRERWEAIKAGEPQ